MIINRNYNDSCIQYVLDFSEYYSEIPTIKEVVDNIKRCYDLWEREADFQWDFNIDKEDFVCRTLNDKYRRCTGKFEITYNYDENSMAFIKVDKKGSYKVLDSLYIIKE